MTDKGGATECAEPLTVNTKDTRMCRKRNASDMLKTAVGLSAAGILMATSCGSEGLRTIDDGLPAVAGSLEGETTRFTFAPGDTDGDGDADLRDVGALQTCFAQSPPTGPCSVLDTNRDDLIDLTDYAALHRVLTGP